mgnify:CR=1 FL=1
MSERIQKITRLILLIQQNPRITVRRLQEELGLSRRSVYRCLQAMSEDVGCRLENGVVVNGTSEDA